MKKYCKECNKKLSRHTMGNLCQICYLKNYNPTTNIMTHKENCICGICQTNRKEKKFAFKHGKPKCKDCGKELSNYNNKRCVKHWREYNRGINAYNFGKSNSWKRIRYKGIWMKSSWESKYAEYLDKNNIKWLYESKTFNLGDCTYTPDFYLPKQDLYIEVKGWFRTISINKFLAFKLLYPEIKLKLFTKKYLKLMRIL